MSETNQTTQFETKNVTELLNSIKSKFLTAEKEKFVFLLVGRTGVGKSSTVNTLMGEEIAKVGDWEPTTMSVESYDSTALGVQFTIIDTPGLCDDLEEVGNDEEYLNLIRSKVPKFDCMWFVSRLDETRVTSDEKRGIKLIGEAFGEKVWEHSIIIFTWANSLDSQKYPVALSKRTELIRNEISKHTDSKTAQNIPSVAVDNTSKITPDGAEWLGELYTKVMTRISEKGVMSFYISTASRVVTPKHKKAAASTSSETENNQPLPNNPINLSESQVKEVQKRIDASVIPFAAITGASIGAIFGPAGAAIGGGVGAAVGLIAWLWD